MNERIEKFARECGAWNQVYGNRNFMIDEHFDIEKFAELIVQECSSVAIDNGCGDFVDIKQKLFEHFGVEP